jgi:ABC-2 type transport system ATP-binding protein
LTRVFREPGRSFRRSTAPPIVALDDVTLRIECGECVALAGPNGAGKSTLLRVLATLVLPTAGAARVHGVDVAAEPGRVRPQVGVMTGDDRSFFWRLSGLENLAFFGELQGLARRPARERAAELIDAVGLAAAAERRFAGYSTGMRQRLGLARALLNQPRVLLLDEPTANLDLEQRGGVLRILRAILSSGDTTALIASHDAGLAVTLADRVIRLELGRIVASPAIRAPAAYVVRVAGLNDAQRAAFGMAAGSDVVEVADLGDGHALAAAVAAIVSGGGDVLDVESAVSADLSR